MKTEKISLFDNERKRKVETDVFLPEDVDNSPILYFSHGAGGTPENYLYLFRYLTKHGYSIFAPHHPGSDRKALKNLLDKGLNVKEAILKMLEDKDEWINRPKDISFLIDETYKLKEKWKFLNLKKMGAFGHSYGSYTVTVISGAKIFMNGNFISLKDERIKAVVSYSPQGDDSLGIPRMFKPSSWKDIKIPFLQITGSNDIGIEGQPVEWRMQGFKEAESKEKYFLLIYGANHFDFTDKGKDDGEIHKLIKFLTYTFFEIVLSKKINLKVYLREETLRKNFVGGEIEDILLLKAM